MSSYAFLPGLAARCHTTCDSSCAGELAKVFASRHHEKLVLSWVWRHKKKHGRRCIGMLTSSDACSIPQRSRCQWNSRSATNGGDYRVSICSTSIIHFVLVALFCLFGYDSSQQVDDMSNQKARLFPSQKYCPLLFPCLFLTLIWSLSLLVINTSIQTNACDFYKKRMDRQRISVDFFSQTIIPPPVYDYFLWRFTQEGMSVVIAL